MKLAWTSPFDPDDLPRLHPVQLPATLTKDWAWGGADGSGVRVAVVDSGIDANHPDVGEVHGWIAIQHDPQGDDEVRYEEDEHSDLFGHGTACAGIIRRVAPAAELYSVRVLGRRLSGKGKVFAAGLRWAIDNGMNVINISLGTDRREHMAVFHELTDKAFFQGQMIVCAANNLPRRTYPAEYASVFSVASHANTDPFGFDYNPEPPMEFGAPGIDVEVPWVGGRRMEVTGNSFAAAHLTGLITRILSKHPGLTPFQMKSVLLGLADNAASG